ncbi:hypothetical protein L6267_00395 [Candidatus Parcubacteria bacterium]|nr:hypothetical protein [Candidatus Parcubacteria bacterium]
MNHEKNQEKTIITPDKELEYALDGVSEEDYGDVADCLNQFAAKLPEAGLSAADRGNLKSKLEEIRNALAAKEIPEEHKMQIKIMFERAVNAL